MKQSLFVKPLLSASAISRPSIRGGCEFTLDVKVKNVSSSAPVHISKLTTISPSWQFQLLSSFPRCGFSKHSLVSLTDFYATVTHCIQVSLPTLLLELSVGFPEQTRKLHSTSRPKGCGKFLPDSRFSHHALRTSIFCAANCMRGISTRTR